MIRNSRKRNDEINIIVTCDVDGKIYFDFCGNDAKSVEKLKVLEKIQSKTEKDFQNVLEVVRNKIECRKCHDSIKINLYWEIEEQKYEPEPNNIKLVDNTEQRKSLTPLIKEELLEDNSDFEDHSTELVYSESPVPTEKLEAITNKTKIQSRKIKVETRIINTSLKIPPDVILPNLQELTPPYFLVVDQPNGTKLYLEQKKANVAPQLFNFDVRILRCDICEATSKTRFNLINHRKLHFFQKHTENKCVGCKKIFENPKEALLHTNFCTKKSQINFKSCTFCDFIGSSYRDLRSHIGTKHGGNGKYDLCHICSTEINCRRMSDHLKSHAAPDRRAWFCNDCGKGFTEKSALRNHLITIHRPHLAKFHCKLCPRTFTKQVNYDKHLGKKHEMGPYVNTSVACEICGIVLASQHGLNGHMSHRHSNASERRRFDCPHCDKFFFRKQGLKAHLPLHVPENERPFQCWCGRGFAELRRLKEHQVQHTNPDHTPFRCDDCGKGFKYSNSLKVHRRAHTGETPYECKFCKKPFADRSNYRVHMKNHEKEMGIKLTLNPEERRLVTLNVLTPEQMLNLPTSK